MVVDCVALPGNLAESLMFGHERGSFTGADQAHAGAFEEAGQGTVLLDEIGDMADIQGKLLRVLESRTFQRVGSVKEISLKARVVAATNQDLQKAIRDKRFREDLYYRLNVARFVLPALRERREDIPLLMDHFLKKACDKMGKQVTVGEGVLDYLMEYPFPGNIRELRNVIERANCTRGVSAQRSA